MNDYTFTIQQMFDALGDDEQTKQDLIEIQPIFRQNKETGELTIEKVSPELEAYLQYAWKVWNDR